MAKPVPMKQVIQADPREELMRRIENAPVEHADAVLSAYELLQGLHDTGTLDVLRGMLGAGNALVEHVVTLLTAPEAVTAIRNLIVLGKALGSIDPEVLRAVVALTAQPKESQPPSLLALGKRAVSEDARRGLSLAVGALEILGKGLAKE